MCTRNHLANEVGAEAMQRKLVVWKHSLLTGATQKRWTVVWPRINKLSLPLWMNMNVNNIADSYNFTANLLWYFMLILARKPGKDELGPMFTFLKLKYQEQKVWYVLTSKLESNL